MSNLANQRLGDIILGQSFVETGIYLVHKQYYAASNANMVFSKKPIAGHVMFLWVTRRDSGSTISTPSGWTLSPEGVIQESAGLRAGAMFYKVSDGTEVNTGAFTGQITIHYAEFANLNTTLVDSATDANEFDTSYEVGALDGTGQTRVLVIGGTMGDYFGSLNDMTPTNGAIELSEGYEASGEKPGSWFAYKIVDSPTSSENIVGTGPNSNHTGTSLMFAEATVSAPSATWVSPADGTPITSTPVFVFNTVASAVDQHCHMQIDTANTFNTGDLRDLKTTVSQTGWEYWNGTAWTAIPSTGIPAAYTGNQARYTVQTPLSTGVWYRRVRVG